MSIWHFGCGHYGDTDAMENYDPDGELCDNCWEKKQEEEEEGKNGTNGDGTSDCGACDGSGIGMWGASKCTSCGGKGYFTNKTNTEEL